jgi:hypothetical protein
MFLYATCGRNLFVTKGVPMCDVFLLPDLKGARQTEMANILYVVEARASKGL